MPAQHVSMPMSTGKCDLYIPVYILRVSLCRVGTLEWMCQRPVATVTVAGWEVETSGELCGPFHRMQIYLPTVCKMSK